MRLRGWISLDVFRQCCTCSGDVS